jgi:HSP20 family protein
MKLVRYNPGLTSRPAVFGDLIEKYFNDGFGVNGGSQFTPQVDIVESKANYQIQLALPGMEKNDFHVDINDDTLTISGERKFENESKEKNYHSLETYFGSFKRAFNIPKDVEQNKIDAIYKNGILDVILPKDAKTELKSTIKVK